MVVVFAGRNKGKKKENARKKKKTPGIFQEERSRNEMKFRNRELRADEGEENLGKETHGKEKK